MSQILPKVIVRSSADLSLIEIIQATAKLENATFIFNEQSIEIDPATRIEIQSLNESIHEWCKTEFDYDVQERLVPVENISFFSPQTFTQLAKRFNLKGVIDGFFLAQKNVIAAKHLGTEQANLGFLMHEMMHGASYKEFDGNLRCLQCGYHLVRDDRYNLLNEALTEIIRVEILQYHLKKTGIDYVTPFGLNYRKAAFLLDSVIQSTGHKARSDIYKGYFDGDTARLDILSEAFVKDGLELLATIDINFDETDVCARFGIKPKKFLKKYNHYRAGKRVRFPGKKKIRTDFYYGM